MAHLPGSFPGSRPYSTVFYPGALHLFPLCRRLQPLRISRACLSANPVHYVLCGHWQATLTFLNLGFFICNKRVSPGIGRIRNKGLASCTLTEQGWMLGNGSYCMMTCSLWSGLNATCSEKLSKTRLVRSDLFLFYLLWTFWVFLKAFEIWLVC